MTYQDQTQPITPPAAPRRRRRGCLGRLFVGGLLLLAVLVFTGVVVAGTLIYADFSREIEAGITRLDAARDRETFETTVITDRHGEVLWEIFGEGNRTAVSLDQIPPHLIQATVAVEDDSFYDNIGLDAPSLVAALLANLRNPDDRPIGGSTITQQLVRHLAFDYEERTAVSYNRKTKELILAWVMTRNYTKDEILEMYLNEIYYGNLAYGVEAAAQTYFDKSAADLSLAEATLLAGLPQSPVELDPLTQLEAAKERQWIVLNLMASEGFLTQDEVLATYQAPLTFAAQEVSLAAPHFAVYVRQLLEEQFGADVVANGGLRVTTTLDLGYQRLAEQLARQHVAAVGPEHNLTNAALVALKPGTGEILAMLGSVDYHDDAVDGRVNVALSPQQPGSAIKPLTYAAALSPVDGAAPAWTAADLLWDVEVDYGQVDGSTYAPVNYDGRFHGPVRLRAALANSYN
ncbi:MAG: transglycosylase domain-containing protein, partial [Anaerolineales bacterium]|nr:transglycosylase domain-containing protein [Anaerolineales bacterium]